jgi:hypothetical protein
MRLYEKSQKIIESEFNTVWDSNKHIPQLDLFLIHHYNNRARITSLKHLEVSMRLENVEDMPFDHKYFFTKQSEVDEVLSYNK